MSRLISSSFLFEQVQIGETPRKIGNEELNQLAENTKGFSGSDISYYISVNFTLDVSLSPK